MSLEDTNNKITYKPSEPTTVFPFPYPYFDSSDIVVTVEDSEGVVTVLPAEGFTVTANNNDPASGADIDTTLTASYTDGDTVIVAREVPVTQLYDLQDGSSIDSTALNRALDRTVAQSQQIKEEIGRQIAHPVTDPSDLNYDAPSVADRKEKILGYDASGNLVAQSANSFDLEVGEDNIVAGSVTTEKLSSSLQGEIGLISKQIGHPASDPGGISYEAPSVANRKGKALGYNDNGDIIAASVNAFSIDIANTYDVTEPDGGYLRTFNPNTATFGQLADVLAALINDLT